MLIPMQDAGYYYFLVETDVSGELIYDWMSIN